MKINIDTKFSVNDVVYGFHKGQIMKFRVDDIKVKLDFNSTEISYLATAIMPTDCYVTFQEVFDENELHTKEELIIALQEIIKEEEI